jgi:hypothetical protein
MKKIARQLGFGITTAVAVAALSVAPVFAQHGLDDDSPKNIVSPVRPIDGGGNSGPGSTEIAGHTPGDDDSDQSGRDSLRDKAEALIQEKRAEIKGKSVAARQKACQTRQANLDRKITNFNNRAQQHLSKLDGVFTKLKNFQQKKQLNISNYDAVVTSATTAQTNAKSSVDALNVLAVPIDCAANDPASNVATIKTAVTDARDKLQTYRMSLKDLLTTLLKANAAANRDKSNTTTDSGETD